MSILLEALRKSERQERMGQVPTIHQPGDESEPGRAGLNRLWVVGMLAVAAAVLALLFWRQYVQPGEPVATQPPVQPPVEVAARPAPQESAPPSDPPGDAAASAQAGEGRTPMERALPPPAQANDPDPTDPPQAQAGAANTVQAPEQAAQQTTQRPPVTTVQLPRKESAAAQVAPDRQPHQSEPISFWQLPVDIRSQLPPLKITVLVWAERAADRFVLLDSRRRVEGDEVAPGLLVEEIRRDGVVLSFRAYRFLVHH